MSNELNRVKLSEEEVEAFRSFDREPEAEAVAAPLTKKEQKQLLKEQKKASAKAGFSDDGMSKRDRRKLAKLERSRQKQLLKDRKHQLVLEKRAQALGVDLFPDDENVMYPEKRYKDIKGEIDTRGFLLAKNERVFRRYNYQNTKWSEEIDASGLKHRVRKWYDNYDNDSLILTTNRLLHVTSTVSSIDLDQITGVQAAYKSKKIGGRIGLLVLCVVLGLLCVAFAFLKDFVVIPNELEILRSKSASAIALLFGALFIFVGSTLCRSKFDKMFYLEIFKKPSDSFLTMSSETAGLIRKKARIGWTLLLVILSLAITFITKLLPLTNIVWPLAKTSLFYYCTIGGGGLLFLITFTALIKKIAMKIVGDKHYPTGAELKMCSSGVPSVFFGGLFMAMGGAMYILNVISAWLNNLVKWNHMALLCGGIFALAGLIWALTGVVKMFRKAKNDSIIRNMAMEHDTSKEVINVPGSKDAYMLAYALNTDIINLRHILEEEKEKKDFDRQLRLYRGQLEILKEEADREKVLSHS